LSPRNSLKFAALQRISLLWPACSLRQRTVSRITNQQLVAILRKYRMVPHHIVHAQSNEPAEHQVVVDLFNQQSFERTESKICSNNDRKIYSGAIDGRPESAYSASNAGLRDRNTVSVNFRTARNG
jgi:hypothetical protein